MLVIFSIKVNKITITLKFLDKMLLKIDKFDENPNVLY